MEVHAHMLQIIILVLGTIAVSEGIFLYVVVQEYQKQELKVDFLTQIIEERFSKHGKDFDNG